MFGPKVDLAIRGDAVLMYPYEACGVVVGGKYIACTNIAEEPAETFRIEGKVWADYPGQIQAVVHSHCVEGLGEDHVKRGLAPDAPSKADMQGQIDTAVPWGIVVTDGRYSLPPFWFDQRQLDGDLLGRSFRHGTADCYALVRSWYWQERGVTLPVFPRDDGWWSKGENMLMDGFAKAGFRLIPGGNTPEEEPEVGDVVLAAVPVDGRLPWAQAPVNHSAIYVGNGLVLHHLYGRLSRREPVMRYKRFVRHWVRFEG